MPPPFFRINPWIDISFFLLLIVICLIIYFRTKEIYELTSHKGIKYFRLAFLFFALGYLLRLLGPLGKILFDKPFKFWPYTGILMTFLGTMAALCLLFSVLWKRFKKQKNKFYYLVGISLIIALLVHFWHLRFYIFWIQGIIFAATLIFGYLNFKKSKSKHRFLYISYGLLFFAWLANLASIFMTRVSMTFAIILHLISALLFVILLYKVIKKTWVKKK